MWETRRAVRPEAEPILSRIGGRLDRPLVASFKMWPYVGVLLVVLFLLLLLSGFIFSMIVNGPTLVPLLISLLFLTLIVGWPLWLYRDYRLSAKAFDRAGVVLNDGRRFGWPDFIRLDEHVNVHAGMKRPPYRYELIFSNGKAVVMIPKLKNWDEVERLVTSLPGERKEIRSRTG